MAVTGRPIDRVDGRLKVTGAAKYAAEFNRPRMAYAFPVRSTIARGRITRVEAGAAEKAPGVLLVLTHLNAPRLKAPEPQALMKVGGLLGEHLAPLQDDRVVYFGQYVACIVAETYEQARAAAALVRVTYAREEPAIDLEREVVKGTRPERFLRDPAQINEGQAAPLLASAPVRVERTYTTANENQHPMEPHATVADWEGPKRLTVYDSTQGVLSTRAVLAYLFGLEPGNVRVLAPYIGGGFGSKGAWAHELLAAMAAQAARRPVKLAITRQMMQTNVGRRAATVQKIALGAGRDGKLTVIRHHVDTYTNASQFFEPAGYPTTALYSAPLREITARVARLNIGTPNFMRAPGFASGSFALESAMDELAHELKLDPVGLRLLNHTSTDPLKNLPYSSEYLRDCYRVGAERFGWARRKAQPRSVRDGRYLVGLGVAAATYHGRRSSASVRVQMSAGGDVKVLCAAQDLGTGTYTILAQTVADTLGVPLGRITVQIGDSSLPPSPFAAGSQTAASVTPTALAAGEMLREELLRLAREDAESKLRGSGPEAIDFANAGFFVKGDSSKSDSYADIMRRNGKASVEACATVMPESGHNLGAPGAPCQLWPAAPQENSDDQKYSFQSFGAQFAEVRVDEDLGTVRVSRFTSVHDIGRVLNEKTARSQISGGVIYALGQALMEETVYDRRWANPVTRTLADYHVPVNLDVPEIEVHFIGRPDPHVSKVGARGAGEIGGVGVAAAVANAVFNATGKRIRDLPITLDKLL